MQVMSPELSALLAQLRKVGEDPSRDLFDAIVAHGQEVVSPLIALATDDMLYLLDEDVPEIWASYHAIRLLGELRAAEAVAPLMTLLDKDDDYIDQYLPESLVRIGRPAVEPLRTALFDPRVSAYGGARAANALAKIAEDEPELRDEVVGSLIERLDADNPREDHYELRGFIISDLAHMRAVEAMPSIRRAFDDELLDEFIIDRETVDLLMERPEGTTAREAMAPVVERMMSSDRMAALEKLLLTSSARSSQTQPTPTDEASRQPPPVVFTQQPMLTNASRPFGRKVGRNEPCPCGSGKKFKRCCGR